MPIADPPGPWILVFIRVHLDPAELGERRRFAVEHSRRSHGFRLFPSVVALVPAPPEIRIAKPGPPR